MERPVVFSNQNFVGGKAFLVIHPDEIAAFLDSPEEAHRREYLNRGQALPPSTQKLIDVILKGGRGTAKHPTYDTTQWEKMRPIGFRRKKRYTKKLHLNAELLRDTEGLVTPQEKALRKHKVEYVLPDPKMKIHASGFLY